MHCTYMYMYIYIHGNLCKSPIGAFTLAGISGIQISVFASRSKSWDFYKCGHKHLTNYCDQHRAANRKKSCDYLGISTIICIAADTCVNARANNLGILYPIIPSERIKTRARVIFRLDIRHAQFGYKKESSRSAISEIFPPAWTSAKYLSISIAMEISIFLVCECA